MNDGYILESECYSQKEETLHHCAESEEGCVLLEVNEDSLFDFYILAFDFHGKTVSE